MTSFTSQAMNNAHLLAKQTGFSVEACAAELEAEEGDYFAVRARLTAQREFDIVQCADGIQYACINEQAVFFRAHRSGTWVRTSVKPDFDFFRLVGTERITDVDTNAPIFTGHNLTEISAYFKG